MSSEKKKKYYYDYPLVFVVAVLVVFGLVMIYSASSYTASIKFGDAAYFLRRQGMIALLGFALMIGISFIDYHFLLKFSIIVYGLSYVLMIATSLFGVMVNGRRRWIVIFGQQFQPTEIVKIAIILFLAVFVTNLGKKINEYKFIGITLLWDLPLAILVGLNNLSSGIIVLMIAVVITFVATDKKLVYLAAIGGFLLLFAFAEPIGTALYNMGLLKAYQYSRIMVWREPAAHPLDGGYQVLQGLYAIGSGGVTGKGLGESIQKLGFVPEAQNDMIFSIICEELGLFGAITLILVFMFLIYRLIVIANSAPDNYGTLICVGIMAHVSLQVILNICVVSNIIPNTGITLPFISYGGTSVLLLLCEMGLALSVSRQIKLDY